MPQAESGPCGAGHKKLLLPEHTEVTKSSKARTESIPECL